MRAGRESNMPITTTTIREAVTRKHVLRALEEYDQLGPEVFLSTHGFSPTKTYDLIWEGRAYPPKAILGTAYQLATGRRLQPSDFEGGRGGAVKILTGMGFNIQEKNRRPRI
jgi:hypothetical protein